MPSLYQRLLGDDYALLPQELASFHATIGEKSFSGMATVRAAKNPVAKCVAMLSALPLHDAEVPIAFTLKTDKGSETWVRRFGSQRMVSRLAYYEGKIREQLGLITLYSSVCVENGFLRMKVQSASFLRFIPLPLWMLPVVVADEHATEGRLNFNVSVFWGRLGRLVEYSGYLDVGGAETLLAGAPQ